MPIVARTGGLADTVIDANLAAVGADAATGFLFSPLNYETLAHAITRAARLYADRPGWARIQKQGMAADFSWARSGKTYAELYARLREHA